MKSRPPAHAAAARAITSSVHTPSTPMPSALPRTLAVTRPARRPVYGPGPVPTAILVRSAAAAPADLSTLAMAGASSSPCLRASTADSCAITREPSCKATVTAGVAVSNASSSTVRQRRSRCWLAGPSHGGSAADDGPGGHGSLHLPCGGQRASPELAHPNRAETAVRALQALQGDDVHHVLVPDHHPDPVGGVTDDIE